MVVSESYVTFAVPYHRTTPREPPPLAFGLLGSMAEPSNPLVSAGQYLIDQVEAFEATHGPDGLFAGTVEECSQRWTGSAVLDKEDKWHIVPADNAQGAVAARRIKMYSGGAFGRAKFFERAWFEENAAKIFFGALKLPRSLGSGLSSEHDVDGTPTIVEVDDVSASPEDGVWATTIVLRPRAPVDGGNRA